MNLFSRREFSAMMAAGLISGRLPSPLAHFGYAETRAISIDEILDRIKRNIGVEWRTETVDTVKAGDPSREATGVVTTAMATLPVLQQAAARGANLIITSEPTFYSRADVRIARAGRGGGPGAAAPGAPGGEAPDPIFDAKNALIDERGLVIFRLSDHWRMRRPDPFSQGFAQTLGWTSYGSPGDPSRYEIPATTLEVLASTLKRALGARGGIRVVGERSTPIRRVAVLPGTTPITSALETLPTADVVIAGEVREWRFRT
jgi:hypothetical protein